MKALKSVFIALVVVTTLTFLGCHDESNSISEDVQHNASTTNNETKKMYSQVKKDIIKI